jgi:hypothetical protein
MTKQRTYAAMNLETNEVAPVTFDNADLAYDYAVRAYGAPNAYVAEWFDGEWV